VNQRRAAPAESPAENGEGRTGARCHSEGRPEEGESFRPLQERRPEESLLFSFGETAGEILGVGEILRSLAARPRSRGRKEIAAIPLRMTALRNSKGGDCKISSGGTRMCGMPG
jgi:hypothetical protein